MEGSFMIMAGIAVCLLIAIVIFWAVLIGFGIHWIVEHKKEIKERRRREDREKELMENVKNWAEDDMKNFKIVNK